MSEPREHIVDRLAEAGLDTERFVDVENQGKASLDHTRHPASDVEGNYGIYAVDEDPLIILDVDDYDALDDKSGLKALTHLPTTLEQKSPHGGTHRLYVVEATVDGRLIAEVFEDEFGTKNPNPSWGEIRVANQYVVGAGSELNHAGCDDGKAGCPSVGIDKYELHADREIATISPSDILSVLRKDPNYAEDEQDEVADAVSQLAEGDADVQETLRYALTESNDEKLHRLWRGDYSDYGGDRSRAEAALAYKLAFWLQGDKQEVRRAMNGVNLPSDVSQPSLEKWSEREDESYRNSVLSAVDKQTDYFDPNRQATQDPSTVDYSEIEHEEAILRAQATPETPSGELDYQNGGYGYHWKQYDGDGTVVDSGFNAVTNFTLETLSKLDTYEGDILTVRVQPNHPMEDAYEVTVHPTVFNEARTFREEIVRGMTTWFQPANARRSTQQMLSDLRQTVGSQMAPQSVGTEYIGLHGDEYNEWVTPAGTLTADGWGDETEYKFYEKGGETDSSSSLTEKWDLDPDDGADYDTDEIAAILEDLPWIRRPERGLPVLGWFYAAPLKPLIFDEFGGGEGQFNLLQVVGGTGTGKTSTLEVYYQLFGATSNPFGCTDTKFTIEKKFAGSNGLPIWLDEYKPKDFGEYKIKTLHNLFRNVFRGGSNPKGDPSLGEVTFRYRAPVVFSGEQVVDEAAVRRRTIVTQFSSAATKSDAEQRQHFKRLQKRSFRDHAIAYYQHVLNADVAQLEAKWRDAGETVTAYLDHLGIESLNQESEVQGLQTIVFGYRLYQEFAETIGVAETALPEESQLRAAVGHVAENIGPDGRRREHVDDFTELVAQAALEDYAEEGVHYRILDSKKYGGKVLAFHMPSTFSTVKQYIRDFNLENEYSLLGRTDFLDNYADKADAENTYPLAINQRVRNLENGGKAVYIDVERATEALKDEFELAAFTEDESKGVGSDETIEDGTAGVPLANVVDANEGPGLLSIHVTITDMLDPKPYLEAEGTVEDDSATLDFVVRGDVNPVPENAEGEEFIIHNVRLIKGQYGGLKLDFRSDTEFVAVSSTPDEQLTVTSPVADGGSESSDTVSADAWEPPVDTDGRKADAKRVVATLLAAEEESLDVDNLKLAVFDRYPDQLKGKIDRVDAAIEAAVTEYGWLAETDNRRLRKS